MNLNEFRLDSKNTSVAVFLLIGIFSFALFGFMGFKTIIGILFLFLLPSYLILNKAELPTDEKIIFSFFLSIGFFPSIVYYLGLVIGIRKAIIAAFVVLIIVGIILNRKSRE